MPRLRPTPRLAIAISAVALLTMALQPALAPAKKGNVKTVTASVPVPLLAEGSVTATCPKNKPLVGGGFAGTFAEPAGVIPIGSQREGKRGWKATGVNGGLAGATVTAEAYCRKEAPKLKEVSSTVTVEGSGPEATATATCPGKKKAAAGGFLGTFPGGDDSIPTLPVSSVRSGKNAWSASAQIPDGDVDAPLNAFVYCSKKKRKETATTQSLTGEATVADVRSPDCSKGTALAGGFINSPPASGSGGIDSLIVPLSSQRDGDAFVTRAVQVGEGTGQTTTVSYCG